MKEEYTVKRLIDELSKCDGNSRVVICDRYDLFVSSIENVIIKNSGSVYLQVEEGIALDQELGGMR